MKAQIQALIEPETRRVDSGRLKVLAVFRTEPNSQVIGGKVIEGRVEADSLIEVLREKQIIAAGKLVKLQSGKQDVNEAEINQECGIQYEGKPVVKEGDILQFHKEEKIYRKI